MCIDVAAAEDRRDLLATESVAPPEHRGEARRPCSLDNGLLDAGKHCYRALEIALGYEHDVVEIVLEDARGKLARLLNGNALGESIPTERHEAIFDHALHRRVELGLDPDQADVRLDRPTGD